MPAAFDFAKKNTSRLDKKKEAKSKTVGITTHFYGSFASTSRQQAIGTYSRNRSECLQRQQAIGIYSRNRSEYLQKSDW